MKERDFINKIIDLYQSARVSEFKQKNIIRIKSYAIPSKVEDLFAVYCSERIDKSYMILIEQPISVMTGKGKKTIYPDVAIYKNNQLLQIWDIKMDLGWQRLEIIDAFKKNKILEREIKGAITHKKNLFEKNKKDEITVSKKIKLYTVIISEMNSSEEKTNQIKKELKKYIDTEFFYLTKGIHPNEYSYPASYIKDNITINSLAFNKINEVLNEL